MSLDLWWHWQLVQLGWRKKCPHKPKWQALRHEADGVMHMICVGCLRGYVELNKKSHKNICTNAQMMIQ